MPVIEERGVFWWRDEALPEDVIAPTSHVAGLLKIADNGFITLELDGYFPHEREQFSVLMEITPKATLSNISGVLKASGKRVLLLDVMSNGGHFSTNGLSYSEYYARQCLLSSSNFPKDIESRTFGRLDICLDGLEPWLRLSSIDVSQTGDEISVNYRKKPDISYAIEGGKLIFIFDIEGKGLFISKHSCLEMREKATLAFKAALPLTLTQLQEKFGWFDDLFTILTNSEYSLCWPIIDDVDADRKYEWYFLRPVTEQAAPQMHELPTNFLQLQGSLGNIVSNWMKKREEFGPGYYLYLGTRRGVKTYTENLFATLVWGLEALHRRKNIYDSEAEVTKETVARILDKIEDKSDHDWLKNRLQNAYEPALWRRIFDVLHCIPIEGIDEKRLEKFCRKIAGYRNQISHFGAQRQDKDYTTFVNELGRYSDAISYLYHMLILHDIGIDAKIINSMLHSGFYSYRLRSAFVEVGLLDAVSKPA